MEQPLQKKLKNELRAQAERKITEQDLGFFSWLAKYASELRSASLGRFPGRRGESEIALEGTPILPASKLRLETEESHTKPYFGKLTLNDENTTVGWSFGAVRLHPRRQISHVGRCGEVGRANLRIVHIREVANRARARIVEH
ncbi:hypothetical protein H6P81_001830 [Aristolochia fimbriata]|uniref:Uncharacterized protein n=1 Tax=Aristolochia fimbriata TaxID=158543 RepID=A0AAV7FC25_ARIFI|nr:hypothetical protein H6P81_001830 [Aristolochia fimbriata]